MELCFANVITSVCLERDTWESSAVGAPSKDITSMASRGLTLDTANLHTVDRWWASQMSHRRLSFIGPTCAPYKWSQVLTFWAQVAFMPPLLIHLMVHCGSPPISAKANKSLHAPRRTAAQLRHQIVCTLFTFMGTDWECLSVPVEAPNWLA